MTQKNTYPTGHGMDIELVPVESEGQTVFPLTQRGPFTFANVLLNGVPAKRAVEGYCAAQEPPITPAEPYLPTFTDVDGGQSPSKAWKMTWTSTDRVLTSEDEDSIRVQMYFAQEDFVATAGQTIFPATGSLARAARNVGVTSVLVNGNQRTSGFTIADVGAGVWKLTFTSGLALDDKVTVSYSDYDTMAKVIEGTTYRDEIFPKDKNIATVSKPWIMARLADNVGTLANDLLIPSGLKITGVLQGQTPMTQIQQVATLDEYEEVLSGSTDTEILPQITSLTVRGATKSPVFRNLVFQYIGFPIDAQAPFECYKCKYDHYTQMQLVIDNRLTFLDPEDPCEVGMRKTIFNDCEFSNFYYFCMVGVVSGFEMTSCHVHDAPANVGYSVLWFAAGEYWSDQETLMTTLCSYNRVEGCEIDHTNIPELFCSISLSGTDALSTQATNNIVTESTFTLFKGLACIEAGFAGWGGQVSKFEISDNTFNKCDCPVFADGDFAFGGTTTVKDSIVTDNTFIDQNLAPASSFWTGDPERFPNGVNGPAIWLQGCYKCQIAGNHYKQSGIEPDVDPYESAIWLDYSNYCKVYEKKSDFPDNLPIEHWVGETESYNNSLNNGKPPKKHRGARCTYLTAKVGERHREIRARRHQA